MGNSSSTFPDSSPFYYCKKYTRAAVAAAAAANVYLLFFIVLPVVVLLICPSYLCFNFQFLARVVLRSSKNPSNSSSPLSPESILTGELVLHFISLIDELIRMLHRIDVHVSNSHQESNWLFIIGWDDSHLFQKLTLDGAVTSERRNSRGIGCKSEESLIFSPFIFGFLSQIF